MSSTDVVPAGSEPDYLTGLEDIEAGDLATPRLKLDHTTAKFVNTLTNESFDELDVVILGVVKQRILWDPDVDEGDQPLCKSLDFKNGLPDERDFPWQSTGFTPGASALPCGSCPLKEWGSHPNSDKPWCSEQWVFPVLIDGVSPAILTLQRSSLKPARAYVTEFAGKKQPMFICRTTLGLTANRKGTVSYAVPKFVKGEATEQDAWPDYANGYRSIRAFVTTPRSRDDEDETTAAPAASAAPAPAPAAQPASTQTAPAASDTDDDGDIPF